MNLFTINIVYKVSKLLMETKLFDKADRKTTKTNKMDLVYL